MSRSPESRSRNFINTLANPRALGFASIALLLYTLADSQLDAAADFDNDHPPLIAPKDMKSAYSTATAFDLKRSVVLGERVPEPVQTAVAITVFEDDRIRQRTNETPSRVDKLSNQEVFPGVNRGTTVSLGILGGIGGFVGSIIAGIAQGRTRTRPASTELST